MTRSLTSFLETITDSAILLPVDQLHRLSDMPPASATTFEATWPSIDLFRRREIMRYLAEICQTNFAVDFSPLALLGLGDEDMQVRLAALDILWDTERAELIAPILELVQSDPEVAVQANAALVLGQFVLIGELGEVPDRIHEQLTQDLLDIYQDRDRALLVRCRTLEALAPASRSEIPDLVGDAFKSGEETLKISAVSAMGRTADPRWEPIIAAEFSNVNPSMRYQAARAAGRLGLQAVTHQLIDLLDDPDLEVLSASIWALGEIGGQVARGALEALLDDEELGGIVADALDAIDLTDGMMSLPSPPTRS